MLNKKKHLKTTCYIQEAKEIRKTKLARAEGDRSATTPSPSISSSGGSSCSLQPGHSSDSHVSASGAVLRSPIKQESAASLTFTGLFSRGDTTQGHLVPVTPTGSVGTGTLVSPCSSSLQDFSDENSNVSQSSYLTEKDLKLQCMWLFGHRLFLFRNCIAYTMSYCLFKYISLQYQFKTFIYQVIPLEV